MAEEGMGIPAACILAAACIWFNSLMYPLVLAVDADETGAKCISSPIKGGMLACDSPSILKLLGSSETTDCTWEGQDCCCKGNQDCDKITKCEPFMPVNWNLPLFPGMAEAESVISEIIRECELLSEMPVAGQVACSALSEVSNAIHQDTAVSMYKIITPTSTITPAIAPTPTTVGVLATAIP